MIQTYEITAPLAGADGEALCASLTAQMDKLKSFYPALRSASVSSSEGLLRMQLRVSGCSRWHTSYAARRVGSSMLRRVKLPPEAGVMVLMDTAAGATSLTKEQGRNAPNRVTSRRSSAAVD